ncbi:family 1 glycosylhydrolase, partial [Klebsiella pneumoniae]|uniref:family 1 glycosylhydrolase n=1 Tax=Klebsiella pneumoniae TaxID=573 RepID=UPI0039C02385
MGVRCYIYPIFRGHYPADAWAHVGADAPRILTGDMARIAQPLDFLGINFYTRGLFDGTGRP